ncbi:hypothetical protein [Pararhizobium antarcticum]|uniref:Uncharacterized protein n=1 Tax=Pararhizobium antarcticum TaxID=1798805 RepID=A0A657LSJ0_9HYPH|nr:hypothetical protein [Pararhizobium antarcticum]OJF95873.1 hypothetical protein AX760_18750 [Pararhizobium antarcticum]OJF99315.1 hypothetical protein AX761_11385 [Rhizobium sp. 58]
MSSEIGFYPLTQGQMAGDVQSAEVGSASGANASPFMMKSQVSGQTLIEVFRFANIQGIPIAVDRQFAGDVDSRLFEVNDTNGVELKRIYRPALTSPINDNWGCRVRYRTLR